MRARRSAGALVALLVGGCRPDGGAAPTSSAAVDGSAPVAASSRAKPSREEIFEMFLEAARTNLERPRPTGSPEAERFYDDAGRTLLGKPPAERWEQHSLGTIGSVGRVAEVLAKSDDPRVEEALRTWAARPRAAPHLETILWAMSERPRASYLETVEAILGDGRAVIIERPRPWGLLASALDMAVTGSVAADVLRLAMRIPDPRGPALVRRLALDRAASEPDPKILAALVCPTGEVRIEDEARAIASRRLMALDALGDRALLAKVQGDPTESAFVRRWAKRMLGGGPDRSKPGWEKHLDPRQRHAFERSMVEYAGQDVSPCWLEHPKPVIEAPSPELLEEDAKLLRESPNAPAR